MNESLLFAALWEIAAANPKGYTVDNENLQPIKQGFSVAVEETQNSVGKAGLKKVIEYVKNHPDTAFGGWYDSKKDAFLFDAVVIVDNVKDAVFLGLQEKQDAIFNLTEGKEIRLK